MITIVERSWTERTKEKLKFVLIGLPFYIASTYLVFFVDGYGVIAGMSLLIGSIFIIIPLGLMFGVNTDHYNVMEDIS